MNCTAVHIAASTLFGIKAHQDGGKIGKKNQNSFFLQQLRTRILQMGGAVSGLPGMEHNGGSPCACQDCRGTFFREEYGGTCGAEKAGAPVRSG